ncbi:hypothetical protein BDB00DRAFT_821529 [Zychaea mexicana]|uniref:uncharacterized protein n=1 Tax=Zychaea mexicana TaxID=64656 RepID=UPI0022FDCC7A|nr:uncharacterized protein BDB00DRAFT_821529 [Zychaea mexicana]KAI9493757.1 hypothetical protein BDB00DRAFT_821529 [Zychaea mexicana]
MMSKLANCLWITVAVVTRVGRYVVTLLLFPLYMRTYVQYMLIQSRFSEREKLETLVRCIGAFNCQLSGSIRPLDWLRISGDPFLVC